MKPTAHVSMRAAWVMPRMQARHTPAFHYVVDVTEGGLVLACVGRMAVSDVEALEKNPPLADRCVSCEVKHDDSRRVRTTISFDTSDLDDANATRELGGEA